MEDWIAEASEEPVTPGSDFSDDTGGINTDDFMTWLLVNAESVHTGKDLGRKQSLHTGARHVPMEGIASRISGEMEPPAPGDSLGYSSQPFQQPYPRDLLPINAMDTEEMMTGVPQPFPVDDQERRSRFQSESLRSVLPPRQSKSELALENIAQPSKSSLSARLGVVVPSIMPVSSEQPFSANRMKIHKTSETATYTAKGPSSDLPPPQVLSSEEEKAKNREKVPKQRGQEKGTPKAVTAKHSDNQDQTPTSSTNPSLKRKRETAEELEERLRVLKEEHNQLKSHLQNTEDKARQIAEQKFKMEKQLRAELQIGGTGIGPLLRQYKDLYSDYGEQRKKEVDFHLAQLQTLLTPTTTTKMSLWTLEQDEAFFTDEADETSLMYILTQEMGLTPEQKTKIKGHRSKILGLVEELKKSVVLMQKIRDMVQAKHKKFDKHMGNLQALLTPKQSVQLLLWITNNKKLLEGYVPDFHQEEQPLEEKEQLQFLKEEEET